MSNSALRPAAVAALLAGASLLAACASVGPDYKGPPLAAPHAAAAANFQRAPEAAAPSPPAVRWWEALNDPLLTRLVDQAMAESPTVHAAEAKLRSARASLGASETRFLPTGSASALAGSGRLSTGSLGALGGQGGGGKITSLDLYNAGFDASWELDIFGGTRRAVEAARADAGAQAASLADARVELGAEVAQAYVDLREAEMRLVLARQAVDLQQQVLDLTRERQARGAAAEGDIERAQTGLEQARAEVPPLEGQIEQSRDRLAVLTGQEPGALDATLAAAAPVPAPPAAVAVGDPADLLRRRPDIRTAERRLAASNARIGQQTAQYFPKVKLLGDIGFSASDPGQVFKANSFSALGGPQLTWSVLDFPRIAAEVRGAKADRDRAADQYQATVLAALQDAEASLSRYGAQRRSLVSLVRAEASASRAAEIVRQRYRGGAASLIDVLDAERQEIDARRALAEGQAGLTVDYIALQKSLGLGWS
jgi:NodT family efflux transporter outer membrane factor (OMF) lipoprotein